MLLILAACRRPVTYELTQLNDLSLPSMSSRCSADRHPPGVREVMGSILVGDFFFFVPRLFHVNQFTFHISLPSLKFAIFIQLPILVLVIVNFKILAIVTDSNR